MGNKAKKRKRSSDDERRSSSGFPFAPSLLLNVPMESPLTSKIQTSSSFIEVGNPQEQPTSEKSSTSVIVKPSSQSAPSKVETLAVDRSERVTGDGLQLRDTVTFIALKEGSVLLIFSKTCIKYISGVCNITVLHGKANINGFKLKSNCAAEVRSPCWMPASRLYVDLPSSSVPKQSHQAFVSQLCEKYDFVRCARGKLLSSVNSSMTVIHCLSTPTLISNDWILLAEDYSNYSPPQSSLVTRNMSAGDDLEVSSSVDLPLATIGPSLDIVDNGLEYFALPPDWAASADAVCKDIKKCPRALLCGAKGVGKSTCVRYAINRLLSKTPVVALIDCDLGQPEFTPSGMVSLHILSDPIFSPPHLHQRTPEMSFFLGELSVKNIPEVFESCIWKLHAAYCRYRDEYAKTGDAESALRALKSSTSIPSSVSATASGGGFSALDDDPSWRYPVPLLVNTDGWVRGMGAELLGAVIEMTLPSHVLHITTEKNSMSIPAITRLVELQRARSEKGREGGEAGGGEQPIETAVLALTPGRHSASRLAAQDLRDLRLVSYFLRDYMSCCAKSRDDKVFKGLCGVSIKSGAIVDPEGCVAMALMSSMQMGCPLSQVCLHLLSCGLTPRLLLSAFNASLVGVAFSEVCDAGEEEKGCGVASCQPSTVSLAIPHRARFISDANTPLPGDEQRSFSLDFVLDDELPMSCIGLGIVADIDLENQLMHVICPDFTNWKSLGSDKDVADGSISKKNKVHLSRGGIHLPTSLLFCGDASAPCTPYMSSESFGEGSSKQGTSRTNLKRRGQQR